MSNDSNLNMKSLEKLIQTLPDNVKEAFGSFMNQGTSNISEVKPKADFSSVENIMQIKNLIDKFNNNSDERVDLINALKPFLSTSRQEKVLKCINILKVSNLFKDSSILSLYSNKDTS